MRAYERYQIQIVVDRDRYSDCGFLVFSVLRNRLDKMEDIVIVKVELKRGDKLVDVIKTPITTNDIEKTRKELHDVYQCDRILFTYNSK